MINMKIKTKIKVEMIFVLIFMFIIDKNLLDSCGTPITVDVKKEILKIIGLSILMVLVLIIFFVKMQNPTISAKNSYYRGVVNNYKGQNDQAIDDLTKAIEVNPKDAAVYLFRGIIYFEDLGNKVKGCSDFKKACELGECKTYNLAKQNGDCQ